MILRVAFPFVLLCVWTVSSSRAVDFRTTTEKETTDKFMDKTIRRCCAEKIKLKKCKYRKRQRRFDRLNGHG